MGTGTRKLPVPERYLYREFLRFLMVSEQVSEKFGTGKSLGTGIGKNWYRKKVSGPVSKNFGTVKSTGIGIGSIW